MAHNVMICRSNPIDPDPRVEKIARALLAEGYGVQAVGWDRTGKLPRQQNIGGLRVFRLRIKARYGSGLMNLPALLLWQVCLFWWLLLHRRSYTILHACDFDTILPALACKFLFRKIVIYDIFDFYADHLRRTPALLIQAIRRADYWAIARADGVILVDDARKEQILGSRPKALISVYNSPEDVPVPVQADVTERPQHSLSIAYVGLLQVERGLFEMIEVLQRHPEWQLHLAGFGGDEERIVQTVRDMPNVHWYGRVAYGQTLALSSAADVLFATYDPAIPNHRYSSPNKIFEAMMLGKPVIVAENTNMDAMIRAANCGIIVEYGNSADLERALAQLAGDRSLRERLGQNARSAYEQVYSWQRMQTRLRDFYRQVLRKSSEQPSP